MTKTRFRYFRALCVCIACSSIGLACGPAGAPRGSELPTDAELPESRAVAIVAEALQDAGVTPGPAFPMDVGEPAPLEVDVRLGSRDFGIEWVSSQDREDHPSLPSPAPNGQLRVFPGSGDDAGIQVLILDASAFLYDGDRDRVQAGATSLMDIEARIRRDVRDFLVHVGP